MNDMNEGEVGTASPENSLGFECVEEVAKRISHLYGDERLSDVTFVVRKSDDEREQRFIGHRNIISTWSRPLDRMLCGDFAEKSSREVYIRDVEPSAFEAMLKLMYRGTVEINVDNVLPVLDVSVRFDVSPLVQFCVQFLQNHTSSEHACRMLEVGVQYNLGKLMDKCIELIVTDDHILESEEFLRLSPAAVLELGKHDSWNMHEDEIFDIIMRWACTNSYSEEERQELVRPILEHIRYPHMSVEKLKALTSSSEVPHQLIFDALFFKLHSGPNSPVHEIGGRYAPRLGSLLFSWVPSSKITVSGDCRENARHTSSNGFTDVRGDRRMVNGVYSWTIDIVETQSSWIFVGVVQADDPNDVAWRSTGRMLYCLDSRYFHQGSGSNHPSGDRKICSSDCIRVVLDCTNHTLAFGVNNEKPVVLFRDLAPVAYVPAVDLRDCGDKVRILSNNPHCRASSHQLGTKGQVGSSSMNQSVPSRSQQSAENNGFNPPVRHSTTGVPPSRQPSDPMTVMSSSSASRAAQENSMSMRDDPAGPRPHTVRAWTSDPMHPRDHETASPRGPHPHAAPSSSNARMSQPRQSQGSQSGGNAAQSSAWAQASGDQRGPNGSPGMDVGPVDLP